MEYYDPNPTPAGRWKVRFAFANEDIDPDLQYEDQNWRAYLHPHMDDVAALADYQLWVGYVKGLFEEFEFSGEKTQYASYENHMTREQERSFKIEFEGFHLAFSYTGAYYARSTRGMRDLLRFIRKRRFMWMQLLSDIPGYEGMYDRCAQLGFYIPVEPVSTSVATRSDVVPNVEVSDIRSNVRSEKVLKLDLLCRFPETLDIIDAGVL